jgi:hypothetical protein
MNTEHWLSHMYCYGELLVINYLSCGMAHILKYFSVLISSSSHFTTLFTVMFVAINTLGWLMFAICRTSFLSLIIIE